MRNCGVSPKGPRSDHSAVQLYFMNWSIKYKSKFIKRTVMDWKAIKECNKVNGKMNLNVMNRLREPFSYTEYNKAILCSGE